MREKDVNKTTISSIIKRRPPHTKPTTAFSTFPQTTTRRYTNLVFFNLVTPSRITASDISISPKVRFLIVCSSLNYFPVRQTAVTNSIHFQSTCTPPPSPPLALPIYSTYNRGYIWNPAKHLQWGLFFKYSEPVEAVAYFQGETPSLILDSILNATLPDNLFPLFTNAASLFPSVTPGTQGLTHLLGRQSKHENWMVRCSPWFCAAGFSQDNQHNLKLTSPPFSLD